MIGQALWATFVVLLILWLVGVAVNWGAFVWLLLIAALVLLVANLAGMLGARRR